VTAVDTVQYIGAAFPNFGGYGRIQLDRTLAFNDSGFSLIAFNSTG
jgi:hypothetical protein